ncbi:putative P450 monooxygenase [Kalaharituber pfeilii]|nr:putative P450 monooxygenase [Kalaharituber pfeilii]
MQPVMAYQSLVTTTVNQYLALARTYPLPLVTAVVVSCLYILIQLFLIAYRLSPFHPLARFPGPKVARATGWYRTYHDIWRGGNMLDELKRLHKIYGPVVRFGPNDLHFSAPNAYLAIYSSSSKLTKDPWLYKSFSEDQSSFGYIDPVLAKQRRDRIAPFFARRNILNLQGVIIGKIDLLCEQLASAAGSSRVVDLGSAFRSLTVDVIMSFCFAECFDALRHPEFRHPVIRLLETSIPMCWTFKHFPIVRMLVMNTPPWVSGLLGSDSRGIMMLKGLIDRQLDSFLKNPYAEDHAHPVIYHRLLEPDAKHGQGIPSRRSLFDEAQVLYVAGSDTVGTTLSAGSYHILSNPHVYTALREELQEAWPNVNLEDKLENGRPGWEALEKLPYLTAVIKESLRMSHGTVSPLSRIVPPQGVSIGDEFVPGGTVIASSAPFVHHNAAIFPDPYEFKPERWLGTSGKDLDKWLVAFSKGPRMCAGINLAWCELYLAFATLYRKFDFELWETTAEDVKFRDFFVPSFEGTITARVKVRED